MNIRFFNPGASFEAHEDEYTSKLFKILREGKLILQDDVKEFENNVIKFTGAKYCVALNSCTDALYLALRAYKIGIGDEVIVPSRTFVATVQVIVQVGATPIFYDIDGGIEDLITDKTKAIIPVHIEGAIDTHFSDILELAKEYDLYVIEDSAQAFGAVFNGKKAGTIGDVGCYSFYPAKTLGAFGDAGALVTNDENIFKWVKGARNHFKEDASDWGINSRLDNIQAGLLNIKFSYYEEALKRREEIASMYHNNLSKKFELPKPTAGRIWQDYIIRASSKEERDRLFDYLKENGVETMKNNYPFPVAKLPLAQKYEDETLRLPCNENLTDEEIIKVINLINKF